MNLCRRLLVVVATALASSAALAQASLGPEQVYQFSIFLLPGLTLDRFLDARRWASNGADREGDGAVAPADLARQAELFDAQPRANRLGMILRADLDGDGVVSREEFKRFIDSPEGRGLGRIEDLMRFDGNQDGRLDWL